MKYYSLTANGDCGTLLSGERLYNASAPLTIGQLPSAQIQLPCEDDMLPQCFCIIVRNTDLDCWQLIRKNDFYGVSVNGKEVDYVCNLNDGDEIRLYGYTDVRLCGCTVVFNSYNDDNYADGHILHSHHSNKGRLMHAVAWCFSLILILSLSISFQEWSKGRSSFSSYDDENVHSSVYKIAVSEILLQRHSPDDAEGLYLTIDSLELDSTNIGTCFFTTDSLCVTARHCVEPWLDFNGWSDNTAIDNLPTEIRWAVMAEESQLEQADTTYRIVSRCLVLDEDSCIYMFTSDKCTFNRSRDIIAHIGNGQHPWRIIYPLYSRKDVELGDFAFIKTNKAGTLQLASQDYLLQNNADANDYKARIYGFPKTNHGNLWEHQDISQVIMPEKEDGNFTRCIQLIVSGTNGYSGSPVIMKSKGRMMVVGIFSKIDDFVESKNTFYAVPANEVSEYNPTEANETKQYRR